VGVEEADDFVVRRGEGGPRRGHRRAELQPPAGEWQWRDVPSS
jgi:hypothetical protein